MKKFLSAAAILMSALCFTACGSTETICITPDVTTNAEGFTVELKTNMEADFEFPIEGVKFDHSRFTENGEIQYGWVIYDSEHKIIGWIKDLSNDYGNEDGEYFFGFIASYNNDVYGFSSSTFKLILSGKDTAQFDKISFTSDYGTITRGTGENSRGSASKVYYSDEYDSEIEGNKPLAGSENYSYCEYTINFDGVDPKKVDKIEISMVVSK